jgi:hypothetical protein
MGGRFGQTRGSLRLEMEWQMRTEVRGGPPMEAEIRELCRGERSE